MKICPGSDKPLMLHWFDSCVAIVYALIIVCDIILVCKQKVTSFDIFGLNAWFVLLLSYQYNR